MRRPNHLVTAVVLGIVAIAVAAVFVLGRGTTSAVDNAAPGAPANAPAPSASNATPSELVGSPNVATVKVSALPPEGRDTLKLIASGGPFPYKQDGVVFTNREGRLPKKAKTYYHEYTVKTPGAPTRGTRRVITGSVGEQYYTADHYATFRRIVPG